MTSKLVVNTIEADTGISSVSFASSISMNSTAKFHFSAAGVDIGADTNINRPAAGALGFNINSSEKVRILSGGVGIHTNNPLSGLHISDGTPYGTPQNSSRKASLTISAGSESSADIQLLSANYNHIFFGDSADPNTGIIWYEHTGSATDSMHFSTAGSERLRIASDGKISTSSTVGHVLFGTDTARSINSHNARLQVTGTSYSHSTVSIINNEANANGAYLFLGKQRSGAVGGNTAVQAGDIIGELRFPAGDGTDMENYAARIIVKADQNASSNNTSGYLDINTTRQNGSNHFKARIHQNSNHGSLFSFGTETSKLNNSTTGDRASFKIGPATHIEGVFGHNGTAGLYYNCYSGGNDLFYRGTEAPSGGDWRPCAYGQKYGGHYFYGDPSNTAYSAQAQVTTMQTNMQISREGIVTKPYQYVFMVETNGTSKAANWHKITGLAPVSSQCTGVSDGTYWSNTNQEFTAPVTGVYHFFVGGWATPNSNGSRYAYCFKHTNGNNYSFIGGGDYCSGDSPMAGWSRTIKLSAGEWVQLWGYSAITATWGAGHRFYWGGYLLG